MAFAFFRILSCNMSTRRDTVKWSFSDTSGGPNQSGNKSRPAYIGLAHELAHVHDGLDESVDRNEIGVIGTKSIAVAELYAMEWENKVRSENQEPLRTHYGNDSRGNVIGQMSQRISMPSTVELQVDFSNPGGMQIVPVTKTSTVVIPIKNY